MKITSKQRLEVMGLMALAHRHGKVMDEVYEALTDMFGENGTHMHDAVYDQDADVERILASMDVKVVDEQERKRISKTQETYRAEDRTNEEASTGS